MRLDRIMRGEALSVRKIGLLLALALVLQPALLGTGQAAKVVTSTSTNTTSPEDDGNLLSDPDNPSEGYYWRINDDYKVYFDPATNEQTEEDAIALTAGMGGSSDSCGSSELKDSGCEDQSGLCNWNEADGRPWWEPNANGDYEETDYVWGRCAAVIAWKEADTLRAYSRGAIRATYATDDPSCTECEDEIQGTWNFSLEVTWFDGLGNILPASEVVDRSQSEHAESVLLGNAIYADFVWGAIGPETIDIPLAAAGFELTTTLINDWNEKETATVSCSECLT